MASNECPRAPISSGRSATELRRARSPDATAWAPASSRRSGSISRLARTTPSSDAPPAARIAAVARDQAVAAWQAFRDRVPEGERTPAQRARLVEADGLLCVAFANRRGVNLLSPQLARLGGRCRLVVTTAFGQTTGEFVDDHHAALGPLPVAVDHRSEIGRDATFERGMLAAIDCGSAHLLPLGQ